MNRSEHKMNRRDWFRLRSSSDESTSQDSDSELEVVQIRESNLDLGSSSAMQPIAHPPNHDGMDLAKLPPMREALLSLSEVLALLMDIESHGTEVQLLQRERTPGQKKQPVNPTLAMELAKQGIALGTISRLQIRYFWRGSQWIDTLESRDASFRLVRIEHC